MGVTVDWDVELRPLEDAAVVAAVEATLAHGGRAGLDVGVVFVDDEFLTDMHGRFLHDPTPTDVITFDLGDGPGPAGEVYVSVDRARKESAARSGSLARELALYVVHGVLHLCGFDDHEDRDRAAMRVAERYVLTSLNYPSEESSEHE